MLNQRFIAVVALMVVARFAAAAEFDAVIDDGTRMATRAWNSPERFFYGEIWLDTKGKIVSQYLRESRVTKDTKVAMGSFDEKQKRWVACEAIEGGVGADLFKDRGKVLRVRVTLAPEGNTINQLLVTNTNAKPEWAEGEFDAIYKGRGRSFTNGRGLVYIVRLERDEKGRVINSFPQETSRVTKETKVAMGRYNEKEDTWEPGDEIPSGIFDDIFKDPGAQYIYVRITYRADRTAIAQILVRQVGEKGKK